MANEMPQPGEYVFKETPWDSYNKTKCVSDRKWNRTISMDEYVDEDEFVTQSLNSMGILDKRHVSEVERNNNRWEIPREDD